VFVRYVDELRDLLSCREDDLNHTQAAAALAEARNAELAAELGRERRLRERLLLGPRGGGSVGRGGSTGRGRSSDRASDRTSRGSGGGGGGGSGVRSAKKRAQSSPRPRGRERLSGDEGEDGGVGRWGFRDSDKDKRGDDYNEQKKSNRSPSPHSRGRNYGVFGRGSGGGGTGAGAFSDDDDDDDDAASRTSGALRLLGPETPVSKRGSGSRGGSEQRRRERRPARVGEVFSDGSDSGGSGSGRESGSSRSGDGCDSDDRRSNAVFRSGGGDAAKEVAEEAGVVADLRGLVREQVRCRLTTGTGSEGEGARKAHTHAHTHTPSLCFCTVKPFGRGQVDVCSWPASHPTPCLCAVWAPDRHICPLVFSLSLPSIDVWPSVYCF